MACDEISCFSFEIEYFEIKFVSHMQSNIFKNTTGGQSETCKSIKI